LRVLVTGSPVWKSGTVIHSQLEQCRLKCVADDDLLVVVHGGARSGVDLYASGWARWHAEKSTHVAPQEVHPARWEGPCRPACWPGHRRPPTPETVASRTDLGPGWDVCPRAGIYRNEEMVALGADLCLAFVGDDDSHGATNCCWLAEQAGIPTTRFPVANPSAA
jgi:YspA, cpYpsA-related SLOG family